MLHNVSALHQFQCCDNCRNSISNMILMNGHNIGFGLDNGDVAEKVNSMHRYHSLLIYNIPLYYKYMYVNILYMH